MRNEENEFKEYSRPIYSIPFLREKKGTKADDDGEDATQTNDAGQTEDDASAAAMCLGGTVTTAMKEAIKNSSEMALKVLDHCLSIPKWKGFQG